VGVCKILSRWASRRRPKGLLQGSAPPLAASIRKNWRLEIVDKTSPREYGTVLIYSGHLELIDRFVTMLQAIDHSYFTRNYCFKLYLILWALSCVIRTKNVTYLVVDC